MNKYDWKTRESIVDKNVLEKLGFNSIPAEDAKKRFPGVNTDGDNVWVHSDFPGYWAQTDLISYCSLFYTIFTYGMQKGSKDRLNKIRESLDMDVL